MQEQPVLLEEDGFEDEILVEEETTVVNAMWGDIGGNIENQTDLQNALDAKQDSLTEAQLNAVNSGITAEKVTTYDGYADQIASKADQSALSAEATTREQADTALGRRIDDEAMARQQADNGLQSQIDAITSKSDVVDVVANYAALQAYDTSSLGNNDVIKVLDDETHEDALTYYRWSTTTQTWSYIGQEAPYYSKGQMDVKLAEKQDKLTAGDNITISGDTISATDTTYTAGNGLNLNSTEFSADTTVLATKEDLEGYYTKPETDTKLAPKLEAEVVAELPSTGTEGKLYLTPKNYTRGTATGNPVTATITDEAGKMDSFKLDGDTYQQSYTGKNMIGFQTGNFSQDGLTFNFAADGTITIDGTRDTTSVSYYNDSSLFNFIEGSFTFTIIPISGSFSGVNVGYRAHRTNIGQQMWYQVVSPAENYNQPTLTKTAEEIEAVAGIQILIGSGTAVFDNFKFKLQVTAGSDHDTSYEPYVGGQPSPSPEYPQQIQTVTGTQTITINGMDYPLDLGNIELNGLGDDGNGNPLYKDRIYKDGEDWKVHNTIRKTIVNGGETWEAALSSLWGSNAYACSSIEGFKPWAPTKSDRFIDAELPQAANIQSGYMQMAGFSWVIRIVGVASVAELKTWLSSNNVTLRYVLATATDTVITDTTLIAQLEAIRTASLQNGTNTITNTATGSNLAGDMEIGYYGFAPRNRYDKWLWLDINNEYEQIGS